MWFPLRPLIGLYVSLPKSKLVLLHLMVIVLKNVLMLFIVTSKGLSPVIAHANYECFVTFLMTITGSLGSIFYALKLKCFSVFKKILAYIENQFNTSIKTVCTGFRGEDISNAF